jgi:oligopeptide transport system ATP-binding protein
MSLAQPETERDESTEASPRRPLVVADKLTKLYPVRRGLFGAAQFLHAVDEVSVYVRRRETVGIVGESGSGKTTLGKLLLRLIEPTLGRVELDGHDVTRAPEAQLRALRRRMQIVFQDPTSSLNPRMTVRELVAEGLLIHRLAASRRDRDELVVHSLARVGLGSELLGRYPHEFSGGQRQRIALARALILRPDFLVLDEPVSALDVSVQAQIVNLLMELQEELEVAYLIISHDLRMIEFVSHRIMVMYLGHIVESGPASIVSRHPLHPYTRALYASRPGRTRPLGAVLPGEPPSAVDPPRGCVFHPRCARAEPGRCDVERPELLELEPGSHHRVACFHPVVD